MNSEQIQKKLAQAVEMIEECRAALGAEITHPTSVFKPQKKVKKGRGGATDPIKTLIEQGFFKQPKTDIDVQVALKKRALIFSRGGVATPLMRLVQQEALEREGGGTRTDPWKYKSN